MQATSEYLNRPVRSMSDAMRDSARKRFEARTAFSGGQMESFELSQEFRDYRYALRRAVNGSNPH